MIVKLEGHKGKGQAQYSPNQWEQQKTLIQQQQQNHALELATINIDSTTTEPRLRTDSSICHLEAKLQLISTRPSPQIPFVLKH